MTAKIRSGGHPTCAPVVTGSAGNYWAICHRHQWRAGPFAMREFARRSAGAHRRAKRRGQGRVT